MATRRATSTGASPVSFRVVITRKLVKPDSRVVLLERDLWSDFGYRCAFRVFVAHRGRHRLVGTWKILQRIERGARTTQLPRAFDTLGTEFISLGQDLAAYEQLAALPRRVALAILSSLHDVVFEQTPDLRTVDGFERAMVRFADASEALRGGRLLLERKRLVDTTTAEQHVPDELVLRVSAQLQGFDHRHDMTLSFRRDPLELGLRRVAVIVGENGSGKTQLLAAMARGLSGLTTRTIELSPAKPFTRVVAVAYGAFDHFTHPRILGGEISYVYCGLRVPDGRAKEIMLDLEAAMQRVADNVLMVAKSDRRNVWQRALEIVHLKDLVDVSRRGRAAVLRYLRDRLSAGQKLVALTLTNLAYHLRAGAVVLHDEPETHLHPALLSGLLRALHVLLHEFDSYAVIATHSLIPLQETPSTNVTILKRYGDGSVSTHQPVEQSFASTLDEISRHAFGMGLADENFRTLLVRLRAAMTVEQIRGMLGGDLGLGTKLQLASLDQ